MASPHIYICGYMWIQQRWHLHIYTYVDICGYGISVVLHDLGARNSTSLPFKRVTWLIHMFGMTHSYVWHDSFICVTWLVYTCDMTIRICGMANLYVWHDSFICVTWLLHMFDMTHSYVWHDSFKCVTWLIHTCDMTHSYICTPVNSYAISMARSNHCRPMGVLQCVAAHCNTKTHAS